MNPYPLPEQPCRSPEVLHWDQIRMQLQPLVGHRVTIASLAGPEGWYSTRAHEVVEDYINYSWDDLQTIRGFGRGKIQRLVAILSTVSARDDLAIVTDSPVIEESKAAAFLTPPPSERLATLGIPEHYPIDLVALPVRVISLCHEERWNTIGLFLESLSKHGGTGFLRKFQNIGKSSITAVERLIDAIWNHNGVALPQFLPCRIGEPGVFLGEGLVLLFNDCDPEQQQILFARLTEGETLDSAGKKFGLTRERVRQIEVSFLSRAAKLLSTFASDQARLFDLLSREEPIIGHFENLPSPECRALAEGTIRRFFKQHLKEMEENEGSLRFEAWLNEFRSRSKFYHPGIHVRDFLKERNEECGLAAFLRLIRKDHSLVFDESSGRVKARSGSLRPLLTAVLVEIGADVIEAEEVLERLRENPNFSSLTASGLQRSYLEYRKDPAFPQVEIRFQERSGATLLHAADSFRRTRKVFQQAPAARCVPAEILELESCNALVTQALSTSGGNTILGLLPITEQDQHRIAEAVRKAHQASTSTLLRLMGQFPGAIAYAVTLAPGTGMDSSSFWPAVDHGLGLMIPAVRHPEVSYAYMQAVAALGLLAAESRERNLLWPILFQAGIVPQFVPHLGQQIGAYLGKNPPPDYEDREALTSFAAAIRDRIPAAWVRLREILASAAGLRICAAILEAHRSDNFSILPPHLSLAMKEALGAIRPGTYLASPALHLDPESTQLFLRLPSQPRKFLLPGAYWQIGDGDTFPADETSRVPLTDANSDEVVIHLRRMRPPFEDRSSSVTIRRTSDCPVQVFRLPQGKQMSVSTQRNQREILLPSGDYGIVVDRDCTSNIEVGWTDMGDDSRWIEYQSFPGQLPLILEGEHPWTIKPKEEPDLIILTGDTGGRLKTRDGQTIYHGTDLFVACSVPSNRLAPGDTVQLSFRDTVGKWNSSLELQAEDLEAGQLRLDADWVHDALIRLSHGIHEITFSLNSNRVSLNKRFLFWSGFSRQQAGFGYRCRTPLHNVDLASSRGVVAKEDGLYVPTEWSAADIQLTLEQPSISLTLPKPGASVRLIDPRTFVGTEVELAQTRSFEAEDATRVSIEVNGLDSAELVIKDRLLAAFPSGAGQFVQRVSGLFDEFGDVVPLELKTSGSTHIPLLKITKLAIVQDLRVSVSSGSSGFELSFRIPRQYTELGIRTVSFSDAISEIEPLSIPLTASQLELPVGPFERLSIEISESDESIHCLLRGERNRMRSGIYAFEFLCRRAPEEDWMELQVSEGFDLCGSRVCMVSEPFGTATDHPLNAYLRRAWEQWLSDDTSTISPELPNSPEEISSCFRELHRLLDYKYAGASWPWVKWSRTALLELCNQAAESALPALLQEAIHSIAGRSSQTEAAYRPLAFGIPSLWSLPADAYQCPAFSPNIIQRTFHCIGALGCASGLELFLRSAEGREIDTFPLTFLRFGVNGKVSGIDYERLFQESADAVFERGGFRTANDTALLSADHFAHCLRALDLRVRAILSEQHSTQGTPTARHRVVTNVLRVHTRLPVTLGFVKGRLGMPNTVEFDLALYSPSPAREIRQLMLVLTALARLRAHDRVSEGEYRQQLTRLFGSDTWDPGRAQKRLSLLVGLAPELFSASLLLWELLLRTHPTTR